MLNIQHKAPGFEVSHQDGNSSPWGKSIKKRAYKGAFHLDSIEQFVPLHLHLQQITQDSLQDPTISVVIHFNRSINSNDCVEFNFGSIGLGRNDLNR